MKVRPDVYLDDLHARADLIGFAPYVQAISTVLLDRKLATPFTVGVYGKWGSGKSSLMNLIRLRLEKKGSGRIFPVWFTPWQYQNQPNLLAPLFLTLLDEAKKNENLKIKLHDVNKELGKLFNVGAESLLELLAKPFFIDTAKVQARGEKYEAEHDIRRHGNFAEIIFVHRLREQFEKLIDDLIEKDGKVVIFIDDLDRCDSVRIISMLESIKLFIGVKRCVFVVGMNYEIVSRCIRSHYGNEDDRENMPDSEIEEYLEKIIQLPFRIPALRIKEVEEFIDKVENDKDVKKFKTLFAKYLPKTPRKIKKVLNIFRLMVSLTKYGGVSKRIKLPLLAKMIIIRERWPFLYARMEDNPNLLKQFEKETDTSKLPSTGLSKREKEQLQALLKESPKFSDASNLEQYFTFSETTIPTGVFPTPQLNEPQGQPIESMQGSSAGSDSSQKPDAAAKQ